MTARRVLVTGGAGYLGQHVAYALARRCVVYDALLYADEYLEAHPFVFGDVRDFERLKLALHWADCVVWLAAIVGDAACMTNADAAIEVNHHAVRWLAENYGGRIIFTSTCSVYGANERAVAEDAALAPKSLYAETKLRAEKELVGADALVLRLGTLYGPSKRMRFDLVVNQFALQAVRDGELTLFGGEQHRPLLGVKDAARFIARMVDADWEPGTYNVAGVNLSIREVAGIVRNAIPGTRIRELRSSTEDGRDYSADCTKAVRELGFKPQERIFNAVLEMATLLRSGRLKDPNSERYHNLKVLEKNRNNG